MLKSPNNELRSGRQNLKSGRLLSEIWYLISHNGKWWLIPFLFSLLIMGAILSFAGTGAAPFIYTLF